MLYSTTHSFFEWHQSDFECSSVWRQNCFNTKTSKTNVPLHVQIISSHFWSDSRFDVCKRKIISRFVQNIRTSRLTTNRHGKKCRELMGCCFSPFPILTIRLKNSAKERSQNMNIMSICHAYNSSAISTETIKFTAFSQNKLHFVTLLRTPFVWTIEIRRNEPITLGLIQIHW